MIRYVDSSVVLRAVLGQRGALAGSDRPGQSITSALTRVECLRTLDRLRLEEGLSDDETVLRREAVFRVLASLVLVDVTPPVLERSAQPLPTVLGTLDSIHLSTALLWREIEAEPVSFATHDHALARAARACGLEVIGAP
ncbi:MAG: type II toxin-antitoxin system VapC family toxin [Acidobacteria bacterium]|nr:type II toxin-antitoxin system VapC family toxin [Acidobacteriota bacterium]